LVILDQFQDILLVCFGALLGVNIRFILFQELKKNILINDFSILIINTFSSFLLGIFLSVLPRISSYDFSYKLVLFFSIGLLGSLSTFSTFVYDLCNTFVEFKFFSALKIFFISMFLGIISLAFGLYLGNQ
tara:strand:+ start:215 stop:607 length:393 start_codon:yes stop_codon:yes gene_type:complete